MHANHDGSDERMNIAPTYIITESRHLSQNKKMQKNKSMGKLKTGRGNTIKNKKEEGTIKIKKKVEK